MSVKVLHAGLALPQDEGRLGYSNVGVARSGAFNNSAYRLLGNLMGYPKDYSYPSIELLAGSISFRPLEDVIFAVVGNCRVDINGFTSSPGTVSEGKVNDYIYVETLDSGPAYISFDGLVFPKVLDSISFDSMSQIGNPKLKSEDILNIDSQAKVGAIVGQFTLPTNGGIKQVTETLRIIAGPHNGIEILTSRVWSVSNLSRSGIRLSLADGQNSYTEKELELLATSGNLKSLPVLPGAVQLPVSGNPIILGPDAGVTGGYAVAGVVVTADLPKLAKLASGGKINFKTVTQAQAVEAYLTSNKTLETKVIRVNLLN